MAPQVLCDSVEVGDGIDVNVIVARTGAIGRYFLLDPMIQIRCAGNVAFLRQVVNDVVNKSV